jgi:hypothetical protein
LGGTGTSVNSGGTVSGTGMIGGAGLVVNAGGTLAPGNAANPTGTLTVENLAFESGALYLVQVSGANASKTSVSLGTVLGGGTVQVAVGSGGASLTQHYDILQGGLLPIVGAFAGVNAPNFAASLSETSTDVFLTLNAAELGAGTSLNRNQQNVANGINNAVNASGALPAALSSLFGLTGSNLANALTQVSGETATGSQQTTFDAMGQFMGVMTDPFMDRGGGTVRHRRLVMRRPRIRPMRLRCSPRRRRKASSRAGACGRPASAARNRRRAMHPSARTTPPAASPAPLSAPTT